MRNLFDKLKNNNNTEKNNGLVQVNPVQNNMTQPQNTTLYGHLTSDNTVGGTDTTNNRMNSLQGAISNGVNAVSGFKGGSGTPWGAIAGVGKNTYNFITDKTPSEYSDTEQSVIYPLLGAAMGSRFGPIDMG